MWAVVKTWLSGNLLRLIGWGAVALSVTAILLGARQAGRLRTALPAMSDRHFDKLATRFAEKIYGGAKGAIRLAVLQADLAEAASQFVSGRQPHVAADELGPWLLEAYRYAFPSDRP